MNISPQDASKALGEIEQARGRSRAFHFYSGVGPYFILWGLIWVVADLATEFLPSPAWIWPAAATAGGILSGVLPMFLGPRYRPPLDRPRRPGRGILTYLVFFAFCAGIFTLMWPASPRAIHAFWGVLFGSVYMLAGIWWGARGFVIGLLLFALSLIGFLYIREHFFLFMGVVGGGAMILGGLWINRA